MFGSHRGDLAVAGGGSSRRFMIVYVGMVL